MQFEETIMWKNINGNLFPTSDESREKFRTTISSEILNYLSHLADEHDTYVNYLLETGIQTVLDEDYIIYDKALRPKDRVQYKTTYDKQLLKKLKKFAADHKLFINDVIEYSVKYINPIKARKKEYRSRIEKF